MSYTEHEKVGFVERMWAEGLRPATAHRLWGAPTRASLRKWELEALAGELPAERPPQRGRAEHAKHTRWPEGTRDEALRLADQGVPTRQIALRLGLPAGAGSLISGWRRQRATMSGEGVAGMGKGKGKGRGDGGTAPTRAELEAEVERLRLDNAALRELVADPKAGGPASLSNRRKAEYVTRLREACGLPLRGLLAFFKISRSSYYYACRERDRGVPEALADRVEAAFEASGRTYGYRRVRAAVESGSDGGEPMAAPERAVRRVMRERGLVPCRRRDDRPWSSYGGEPDDGRPANAPRERALARRAAGEDFRLAHDFSAPRPGELLVTDVTQVSMNGWRAYLSPVVDCWDGMPVAWRVSAHPDSELCDGSLADALGRLRRAGLARPGRVTVHSDGGACYWSRSWEELCREGGVRRSMSRRAACPDNARAEGFFGTLKREFLHPRDWSGVSEGEFRRELEAWLDWYVHGRLKAFRERGRVRYMTIAEHRRMHGYAVP